MTTLTVQDLLTPEQAAQRIRMSRKWVLARIYEWQIGDPFGLPAVNVSRGTKQPRWRIDPNVLDGWLTSWLDAPG